MSDTPSGAAAAGRGAGQKHVTHNEALLSLDIVVQTAVKDRDLTAPPGSPSEGDAYIVAATATGDWTGNEDDLAVSIDGGWRFVTPLAGFQAWVEDEAVVAVFDGSSWEPFGTGMEFQNVAKLGVNATADATNKLSVNSPAVLLNHDGAGMQLKANRDATGDALEMLFQTNFSTRALFGYEGGSDDFVAKVSPNGSTFYEGCRIDKDDGDITFPNQRSVRMLLAFGGRFFCYTDNRWIGPSPYALNEGKSTSGGTGATPNVDWDGAGDHFLKSGTIIKGLDLALRISNAEITSASWKLF